jgi:ATP-dependent DNA helicase RecG
MTILTETDNGFKIAEKDLEIRGPGDIEGTRQSGLLNFKLANLVEDRIWLELAGAAVTTLLEGDPELSAEGNRRLREFLQSQRGKTAWSKIS